MKITIGSTTYTKLNNLSFAPDTDATSSSVPVNEFTVDIVTTDTISIGATAILKDDLDNLWAQFPVAYVNRLDKNTVHIRAQSLLARLEKRRMDAVMYEQTPVTSILNTVCGGSNYTLDASLQSKTVSGYAPEQSARDRLHWVAYAIGACVVSAFKEKTTLIPTPGLSTSARTISPGDTYYKPEATANQVVSSMRVTAYIFTQGKADDQPDEKKTIGDDTYIVEKQEFWLFNPSVDFLDSMLNPAYFDGVTIITPDNVTDLMSRLAPYVFSPAQIVADVINNASWSPGEKVTITIDEEGNQRTGVIESENFSFGVQAKSRLSLTELWSDGSEHPLRTLTVTHAFPGDSDTSAMTLFTEYLTLPRGFLFMTYPIRRYLNQPNAEYVFRPTQEVESWQMRDDSNSLTINYAKALTYRSGTLTILAINTPSRIDVVVSSSFEYRKDIVIRVNDADKRYQNASIIAMKPLSGSTVYFLPEEYANAVAQQRNEILVIKPVDLLIREGTVNRVFYGVTHLETSLYGGGTCTWVVTEDTTNV